ncbi:V-set and immunoglobulin domain-containing protein 2-like [Toxotes jaculatrix]|uniref:V-set and immunoglobulin domain-containing protein 2-like n=1 Tax=Toxotes jaculatrix TaxID=941984 RepID=UPI001B3B0017|nr:V-set and immunoglobulin domain-containing protein 2-like [Toxotes jaculatrix]
MAVCDKTIPWRIWAFTFLLTGAVGQTVNYPRPVCGVETSTVTLPCTFTPLRSFIQSEREVLLEIVRVRWCKNHLICQGNTPSVYDSNSETNDPRYQYLGDKKGNCTLQIRDLRPEDSATFRFRMEADHTEGHFTGQSGVTVTVVDETEMRIISSSGESVMREGQTVTLHCTANCTFHQLEVTWFRDDHALPASGPAFQLGPLTAGDSGNYTCGLKNNLKKRSLTYTLHVGEKGEDVTLARTVGVVLGVLVVLCALILVFFMVRRTRAQRAVGGRKCPDNICSNNPQPAEEGRDHQQETSEVEEDISYASVQFKHKNQARPVEEAADVVIYSSVASRG